MGGSGSVLPSIDTEHKEGERPGDGDCGDDPERHQLS